MQLQNIFSFVVWLYVNWEKLLWYSKKKKKKNPSPLQSVRKCWACVYNPQRVLLSPGLRAASTFNLQWGKGASPYSSFLRSGTRFRQGSKSLPRSWVWPPCMGHSLKKSDQNILWNLWSASVAKNVTFTALKTSYGGVHSWRRWAYNWCVRNHEPDKLLKVTAV